MNDSETAWQPGPKYRSLAVAGDDPCDHGAARDFLIAGGGPAAHPAFERLDSPHVVEVTVGRLLGSLAVQVLLIAFSLFRAGVFYAEHQTEIGQGGLVIRPEQPD